MKRYFLAITVVLLFASCKEPAAEKANSYTSAIVGTMQNGTFAVSDADVIKKEWRKKLLSATGVNAAIESLQIIKAKAQGDNAPDFYMLLAKTADGYTSLAAVLTQKEGAFYFDDASGVITICNRNCEDGCQPLGIYQGGKIRLACTACSDCEKTESAI